MANVVFLLIFGLLSNLSSTRGFGINLIKVPDDDRSQVMCSMALLRKYFNSGAPLSGSVLYMSLTSASLHTQKCLLDAIHGMPDLPWSIVIHDAKNAKLESQSSSAILHEKPQCYFVVIENLEDEDFEDIFDDWKTTLNWNPLAQFVVYLSSVEETDEEMTELMVEILLSFMNKKIYNVNVIGQNEENGYYYGKTVFPYHPDNNCGTRVISVETLDVCDYQEEENVDDAEVGADGEEDEADEGEDDNADGGDEENEEGAAGDKEEGNDGENDERANGDDGYDEQTSSAVEDNNENNADNEAEDGGHETKTDTAVDDNEDGNDNKNDQHENDDNGDNAQTSSAADDKTEINTDIEAEDGEHETKKDIVVDDNEDGNDNKNDQHENDDDEQTSSEEENNDKIEEQSEAEDGEHKSKPDAVVDDNEDGFDDEKDLQENDYGEQKSYAEEDRIENIGIELDGNVKNNNDKNANEDENEHIESKSEPDTVLEDKVKGKANEQVYEDNDLQNENTLEKGITESAENAVDNINDGEDYHKNQGRSGEKARKITEDEDEVEVNKDNNGEHESKTKGMRNATSGEINVEAQSQVGFKDAYGKKERNAGKKENAARNIASKEYDQVEQDKVENVGKTEDKIAENEESNVVCENKPVLSERADKNNEVDKNEQINDSQQNRNEREDFGKEITTAKDADTSEEDAINELRGNDYVEGKQHDDDDGSEILNPDDYGIQKSNDYRRLKAKSQERTTIGHGDIKSTHRVIKQAKALKKSNYVSKTGKRKEKKFFKKRRKRQTIDDDSNDDKQNISHDAEGGAKTNLYLEEIYRALFFDKYPKDLSGCPLVAAFRPWEPFIFRETNENEAKEEEDAFDADANGAVNEENQTDENQFGSENAESENDEVVNSADAFRDTSYDTFSSESKMPGETELKAKLSGIEYQLLQTISERLHINIELRVENRNLYHLFQQLIDGDIEMVVGGIDEDPSISQFVSTTIPYDQDDLTWCVAKAKRSHNLFNFLASFSPLTWGLTSIALVIVSATLTAMQKILKVRSQYLRGFFGIYFRISRIMLSQSVPLVKFPTPIRLTFAAVFFLALIIVNAYQSFLISTLTTPKSAYQISRVEELYQQRMKIMGSVENVRHLSKPGEVFTYIREKFQMCYNIEECLVQAANNERLAVAVSRLHSFYNPRIPRNQLYCFDRDENLYMYLVTMLLPKKFHLLHKINPVIQHVIESGHLHKWSRDLDMRRRIVEERSRVYEDKVRSLTLGEVAGTFAFTGTLLAIAPFTFILELYIYRLATRRRRRTRLKIVKYLHRTFLQT